MNNANRQYMFSPIYGKNYSTFSLSTEHAENLTGLSLRFSQLRENEEF